MTPCSRLWAQQWWRAKKAIADITVAAMAFLQKLTEDDIKKLDNVQVQARIVV